MYCFCCYVRNDCCLLLFTCISSLSFVEFHCFIAGVTAKAVVAALQGLVCVGCDPVPHCQGRGRNIRLFVIHSSSYAYHIAKAGRNILLPLKITVYQGRELSCNTWYQVFMYVRGTRYKYTRYDSRSKAVFACQGWVFDQAFAAPKSYRSGRGYHPRLTFEAPLRSKQKRVRTRTST